MLRRASVSRLIASSPMSSGARIGLLGESMKGRPDVTAATGGVASANADILELGARLRALVQGGVEPALVCDVTALTDPDCGTVDALARLQLEARRLDRRIVLRNACRELRELLVLAGLNDVLPPETGSGVESGG